MSGPGEAREQELAELLREVRALREVVDGLKAEREPAWFPPEYAVAVRVPAALPPDYQVAVRAPQAFPPNYAVLVRAPQPPPTYEVLVRPVAPQAEDPRPAER